MVQLLAGGRLAPASDRRRHHVQEFVGDPRDPFLALGAPGTDCSAGSVHVYGEFPVLLPLQRFFGSGSATPTPFFLSGTLPLQIGAPSSGSR